MPRRTPDPPRTRPFTIIAGDPAIRDRRGEIVTAQIEVPAERLSPGPMGHRVHIVDYDSSTGTLYRSRRGASKYRDPYRKLSGTRRLINDPQFHQQNVYTIAMETLGRFEQALGRRLTWGFSLRGHLLKILPHAFAEPNAFYSRPHESLLFGYFPGKRNTIFSCLSHDVVTHETVHALLDGLRRRYMYPSSPDQAAFHEGFADVVAILSVFRLPEVVHVALEATRSKGNRMIAKKKLTRKALHDSALLGLAKEMGKELSATRGSALRNSAKIKTPIDWASDEFLEPHRRGEGLVAAMLRAFIEIWLERIEGLRVYGGKLDGDRVIEEGASAADRLLTTAIRAIDYCPPVDLLFGDYLSALLVADFETHPDDSKYNYRKALREAFAHYGILPQAKGESFEPGLWLPAPEDLSYRGLHLSALQREPDEVFRFVWENREALDLYKDAYTYVPYVRPCIRMDPDGFVVRETVAEYVQTLRIKAHELRRSVRCDPPQGMGREQSVAVYGGGTLIFDEYGRLKFHIYNRIRSSRQGTRLEHLWNQGSFHVRGRGNLADLHRRRSITVQRHHHEEW